MLVLQRLMIGSSGLFTIRVGKTNGKEKADEMKLFNTRKVFLLRDYDELVIESPGFDNR